jgi:hypothetical protein
MLLDLLDQSYLAKAPDQNQAQLINMYLEQDPAKGKYKVVAYPMHGLTLFCDTGQSQIRELYELNGVLYGIAGAVFGRVSSTGALTPLATLQTSTGWCKMRAITGGSDNNHQLAFIDGTSMYCYNIGTNVFTNPQVTEFLASIQVLTSGTLYSNNPTITITDPTGSGASATAVVSAGSITSITVDNGGSNYSSPTITITDVTGTGATASGVTGVTNPPLTAIDIDNQDDYIIAVLPNSMSFQVSNVSDTTTWDPLNFASKFGQPDNISAVLSHEGRLWFFGDKTTETWLDTGGQYFPFSKDTSTFLHYGIAAKGTIGGNGNYFLFLSSNGKGGYSVFQTQPRIYFYNPAPVSTPPIDTLLSNTYPINDCIAFLTNLDGHELYHLTSPTGNFTIVYDVPKTQQSDAQKGAWYYRQSLVGGVYGRFLANCQAFCYGKNLVGDYNSGKIYYLDDKNYTENGTPILRQFVSSPQGTYAGGKRVFFNRMQIDVQTGVGTNETFTLEKSVDNGATWQLVNTYTIPPQGGRIYENRLGSSRYGMIFRISTTMNANFCLLGFQAEITMGHS